jgi:general secretion pathway protein D
MKQQQKENNNEKRTRVARAARIAHALATVALVAVTTVALAQDNGTPTITPNYKDANLSTIIEAVAELTGKNFIVDPRVSAQVTMLSTTPLSPDEFYQAFLSILQVHGLVAVPTGKVIKIIPDANARQVPANDLPNQVSPASDELVTQVIAVTNVSAAQLVPILRPLIPQNGHLAAYPASNMLIISDRANNVNRIVRIIRRIDQAGDEEIDVIPLEHASAAEIVRVINALYPQAGQAEGGVGVRLVADERTNSVLVSGESAARLRLKTLVAHLDTPLEAGGDTQVRYMRYADAEKIAAKLKEQASATVAVTGSAPPGTPPGGAAGGGGAARLGDNITLWAEPETNALVITAPPKVMRSLMAIIDKLDIRRPQVLVEAIIVEVSADKTANLGVNWAIDGSNESNAPVGGFIQDIAGADIVDVAGAINAGTGIPAGFTVGVGRLSDTGLSFAAMLRALRNDAHTNIISTPSILTMDNQEAQIKVAQEVPFLTGSFASTGQGGTDGQVNPFQTIQRQEVGTILKITPQISEGATVMLKIEQEASTLSESSQAVDLITNKRTITTNVLVEDGGIIALGGLISDSLTEGEQRVPFLGKIPIIGHLFKARSGRKIKTNLIVFIRPKILRDGSQAAVETNSKYDYLRQMQIERNGGKATLLPQDRQPTLPELPPYVPPPKEETDSDKPPGASGDAAPASSPPAQTQPVPETGEPPPAIPDTQQRPKPRRPPPTPEPEAQ